MVKGLQRFAMMMCEGGTALVTGANSGIGEAIAIGLGEAGANVVVNYVVDPASAEDVADKIRSFGSKAITLKADVSNEEEVKSMYKAMFKEFGTIDILVNNAGLQRDAAFHEMTLDQWNKVINVNLTGQFLCAREAIIEMLRRGVVQDRSVACGKIMQSLAQEYGDRKIRVNSICPGAIQTPINTGAWSTPQALASLMTLIPYNRIGQPVDIANLAVFLASDASDYITGASIFIDGGMTVFEGFAEGG